MGDTALAGAILTSERKSALIVLIATTVFACSASSQTTSQSATFVPGMPTGVDRIRADFTVQGDPLTNTTTVAGMLVRTDVVVGPGVIGPPPVVVTYSVVFGPLSPGDYTYEIYLHYADGTVELRSRQALVVHVSPAAVPVFSTSALLFLAFSVICVASLRIGARC